MQRSRSRKLARLERQTHIRPAQHRLATLVRHASIGAAVMAAISAARAQQPDVTPPNPSTPIALAQQADATSPTPTPAPNTAASSASTASTDQGGLQEVVVTATKQAQNIQSIPVTVTAVTEAALTNQGIENVRDLVQQMPQVQVQLNGGAPGEACVTMRGIAGCGFGFGGQQGSVGVYLDEQPITTPNGSVDWHIYDINRVEVLPGPQGTLYGASSEAGTLRYITNKPDPSAFAAGYTGQVNTIYNGTVGGLAEGFVNIPITSNIAVRLVGYFERDSGYLNNVPQTLNFANGTTLNNAPYVQNHYNPITTDGGRAMFTFKINDDWSINPTIMSQKQTWTGKFGNELWKATYASPGFESGLTVAQFNPEISFDSNTNYTLTVLGKIGDFNLTFASGYLHRHTGDYLEYVDYTLAYQQYETRAQDFYPQTGSYPGCQSAICWPKNPEMFRVDGNEYEYISNELRIASPVTWPVHFIAGLYQDRSQALNLLNEDIPGLNPSYQVGYGTNYVWPSTVYLDDLQTVFRNWAAFIQANWDITSQFTATAGFRRYRYDNTISGFYGYSAAYATNVFGYPAGVSGTETCFNAYRYNNSPCTDIAQTSEQWGSVPLFTLSYKFDPDHLLYATFSKGYRPGGPNRTQGAGPFKSDYLTNYEIGWKTAWLDHHLIFNGDVFYDDWKDYQFEFTGPNGIGLIANANSAASKGVETQLQWLVTTGLHVTLNVEYTDAHLTANYCGILNPNGTPITTPNCVGPGNATPFSPLAPDGYPIQNVPLWKGFLGVRYTFPFANGTGFLEGDQTYQTWMWSQQLVSYNASFGQVPPYGITNFSLGLDKNNWTAELLINNAWNRLAAADFDAEQLRSAMYVATFNIIVPPRLIGLQFSQRF